VGKLVNQLLRSVRRGKQFAKHVMVVGGEVLVESLKGKTLSGQRKKQVVKRLFGKEFGDQEPTASDVQRVVGEIQSKILTAQQQLQQAGATGRKRVANALSKADSVRTSLNSLSAGNPSEGGGQPWGGNGGQWNGNQGQSSESESEQRGRARGGRKGGGRGRGEGRRAGRQFG